MAFVPVPDTVMAEFRYLWNGQRVENVIYAKKEGLADTDLEPLGSALLSWWVDNVKPHQSNQVALQEIFLTMLASETAPAFGESTGLPQAGGNPTAAVPANVSVAVSFRTLGRGRSSRGRNYLIGLITSEVASSVWNPAYLSLFVDAYNALPDALSPIDFVWVVVSRQLDNAPRTTGLAQLVTSAVLVDNVSDSQRRRLPGRGA